MSARRLQLLLLAFLASASSASKEIATHLIITPQSPVIQIGTNFTATCLIADTTEATADDLYWNISRRIIPKNQYTKINESALSVTIFVNDEKPELLCCYCNKKSPYVFKNKGKFIHGIFLTKGYPPNKPKNLTCMAPQGKLYISEIFKCWWETSGYHTQEMPSTYTLHVNVIHGNAYNVSTEENSALVKMDFPAHMELDIWVVAHNQLGTVESEHLTKDAFSFVKTNPPYVQVFPEEKFPPSLLITWKHPIQPHYLILKYEIRYCLNGSLDWMKVLVVNKAEERESYRLQNLQPDTVYVIQVRCKHTKDGYGYWSDWSASVTEKTPEDRPTSKPDLWRIITEGEGTNERKVKFICKEPVFSNGKITSFNIKIQTQKENVQNGSAAWERVPVNSSVADFFPRQTFTVLKEISLLDKRPVRVHVTAVNSVGMSPQASLGIPGKTLELGPVQGLKVWPQGGQLFVKWNAPNNANVAAYVVEWVNDFCMDWQRENRSTLQTVLKGSIDKFICYKISVYPIYSGWTGQPATVEAFLEEGAPLEGPSVRPKDKPGRNEVELVWNEIPPSKRQGFITNYTIFYSSRNGEHAITVPANTTSYTLTSLTSNTKYDAWIRVSTSRGSALGTSHSFITLKYAPGQMEMIVVGVSLGFLFVVLTTMMICLYKKDMIMKNFWPWIPNPGESTIGHWSPDYPLKPETPKENCLPDISMLDVDINDAKSVFEEDKTNLALKKDKYLSEEHSSGIGGSSCMSSPRQSVSDSDEGGDVADTTASTVQYSSVVASSGYKGQTPCVQPQQVIFSRSESTQPLLDSEENPDILVQEGSRQSQLFHSAWNQDSARSSEFNQLEMEPQEVLLSLDLCPLEEDSELTTPADGQSAPVPSYRPQLCGYRPQ
ncbi:interleukin-6 receptor subunit beta [Dunckerocampus dactyliophorus]|uniref:interleukin-6 receptor subunit beta n=1 Tax=Dunckerocampus dactyliophorus TaxID=161453 RepID=UPI0024071408|nr:interleukin-6 receptor subunit beta [Dunckerocampus dactyliophorus]